MENLLKPHCMPTRNFNAKLFTTLTAFVLTLLFLCLNANTAHAAVTPETDTTGIQPAISRIAGDDASGTAAEIAKQMYSGDDEQSDFVVIARDDDFADAMSATGLAGALNAPIVLADRNNGLGDDAKAAISAVGATRAYIIGGTGAIPADIESQLKAINVTPQS